MALRIYEEGGRFRSVDEESGSASGTAASLDEILKLPFRGREIRLHIGLEAFSMRRAVLPALDRTKLMEILPFEMEGLFLLPSAELLFDVYPLGTSDKGIDGLVFALPKEKARQYAEPFLRSGMNLASLSPAWDSRLAAYGLDEAGFYQRALNLAPAGLTEEKKQKKSEDLYRLAFRYAAAVLLLLLLGYSIRLVLVRQKEAALMKETAAVYTSLFPGQKLPPDLYYSTRAKLAELKQNYRAYRGEDLLGVLRAITESRGETVNVKEFSMEGGKALLKGEAADNAAAEQFRESLKKRFPAARLVETKQMPDNRFGFAIEVAADE